MCRRLLPQLDLSPHLGRTEFFAVLPRIYRTQDEPILRALLEDAAKKGVTGVSIGNLGHLPLARGLDAAARRLALNVYNSAALAFWKEQGLSSACVSFELRDAQIRDLSKCLPCEAIVYGRLPLMLTENCLNANAFGCRYFTERPASVPCDGACASAPELTDRRGEHFPVLRAWGCRSEIENGKILYLADKSKDWQTLGLRFAQLRFTTESASECVRVLRAYQGERSKRRRISPAVSSTAAQNEFQIVIFYLDYTFYYQIVRQYHGNRFGFSIPAPSGAARPHRRGGLQNALARH